MSVPRLISNSIHTIQFEHFDSFLPAIIGAVGAIAGGAIGAAVSNSNTSKTNKANLQMNQQTNALNEKMNKENIEFQKKENEITRHREDTAYMRAVADAQAAGLSPLAVSGGASAAQLAAPSNSFQAQQAPAAQKSDSGSFISQGIQQAFSNFQAARAQQVEMDYTDSLTAKVRAEKTQLDINNGFAAARAQAELDLMKERVKELQNINPTLAKRMEAQLSLYEEQVKNVAQQTATSASQQAHLDQETANLARDNQLSDIFGLPVGMAPSNKYQVGSAVYSKAGVPVIKRAIDVIKSVFSDKKKSDRVLKAPLTPSPSESGKSEKPWYAIVGSAQMNTILALYNRTNGVNVSVSDLAKNAELSESVRNFAKKIK